MNIILWILFGAIAGWVAGKLVDVRERPGGGSHWTDIQASPGCITNIVVGIIDAFVGGALYEFTTGNDGDFGFNLGSFLLAIVGAAVFLFILRAIRR